MLLCSLLGGLFGNTQNKGFGFSSGLGTGTAAGATGFGTGLGTSLGGFGGFNVQPAQQQQGERPLTVTVVILLTFGCFNCVRAVQSGPLTETRGNCNLFQLPSTFTAI